jgi:hypothetical protein
MANQTRDVQGDIVVLGSRVGDDDSLERERERVRKQDPQPRWKKVTVPV